MTSAATRSRALRLEPSDVCEWLTGWITMTRGSVLDRVSWRRRFKAERFASCLLEFAWNVWRPLREEQTEGWVLSACSVEVVKEAASMIDERWRRREASTVPWGTLVFHGCEASPLYITITVIFVWTSLETKIRHSGQEGLTGSPCQVSYFPTGLEVGQLIATMRETLLR